MKTTEQIFKEEYGDLFLNHIQIRKVLIECSDKVAKIYANQFLQDKNDNLHVKKDMVVFQHPKLEISIFEDELTIKLLTPYYQEIKLDKINMDHIIQAYEYSVINKNQRE